MKKEAAENYKTGDDIAPERRAMDEHLNEFLWFAGAVVAVCLIIIARQRQKLALRRNFASLPFPAEWEEIIRRNVPLYARLSEPMREELKRHINVFISEKNFEGCGGLELTDEVRVTVAAEACMLLLGRPARYYPGLTTILVYPAAYQSMGKRRIGNHYVETVIPRVGESWLNAAVVLAWDQMKKEVTDPTRRHNVAVHEFAHQLDQEDGLADGIPILERRSSYAAWTAVLFDEFKRLKLTVQRGKPSFLDPYGATNHAEFFAVASEAFFERSAEMKERKPALYAELMDFYKVDPAEWN